MYVLHVVVMCVMHALGNHQDSRTDMWDSLITNVYIKLLLLTRMFIYVKRMTKKCLFYSSIR